MDVPILHYYCRGVEYKNVRVEIFWNWIKSYSQYTETEVIGPVQLRSWRRNIFATMIRVLGGMEKSLLTTLWNVWVKNGGSIRCPVVFHQKIGLSMMWKFQCKEIIIIVVFSFACLDIWPVLLLVEVSHCLTKLSFRKIKWGKQGLL